MPSGGTNNRQLFIIAGVVVAILIIGAIVLGAGVGGGFGAPTPTKVAVAPTTKAPPPATTKAPPPATTKAPPPATTKAPPPATTKAPPPATTKAPPTATLVPPTSTPKPPTASQVPLTNTTAPTIGGGNVSGATSTTKATSAAGASNTANPTSTLKASPTANSSVTTTSSNTPAKTVITASPTQIRNVAAGSPFLTLGVQCDLSNKNPVTFIVSDSNAPLPAGNATYSISTGASGGVSALAVGGSTSYGPFPDGTSMRVVYGQNRPGDTTLNADGHCNTPTPSPSPTHTTVPPNLTASGTCSTTLAVSFTVTNTGGAMTSSESYQVVEGTTILASGNIQLGAGKSQTITATATGPGTVTLNVFGTYSATAAAICQGTPTHTPTNTPNTPTKTNTVTVTLTPTWGKSSLSASGICSSGVLVFTVTNNGSGPMGAGTAWSATDASGKVLGSGTTNALAIGASQQIS
ncbi:MAG: hypothetical protein ACYDBJ_26175, partial [Aggregatilineales bacterium]